MGFSGDPHIDGEMRPSTEWPIQKYIWIDYFVKTGDRIFYKVVPMIQKGVGLEMDITISSDWSDLVIIGNTVGNEVYFNRGLVSSQFLSRRLNSLPQNERSKTLTANLLDVNSKIRNFMGGNLLFALYRFLNDIERNRDLRLYAALYELNEEELIRKLNLIGERANIILANGAFSQGKRDPESDAATKLTKVNLKRRIVSTPHFAHNKFLVVSELKDGLETPIRVLTGSTNWTVNGIFTQVNNAVVLHDLEVAKFYKKEWDNIFNDCDSSGKGMYTDRYKSEHTSVKANSDNSIRTYFTPTSGFIDLEEASERIRSAKKGILFLMFKPGIENKSRMLYDTIKDMTKNENLLVHGVINSDPGGKKNPTIKFINKNVFQQGDLDIVLPSSIRNPFEFWMEEAGRKNVTIHSKTIVIDPFSDNPVVITGSHNMGGKASESNDDNLNIISGNKKLAQAYAIHIMSVYHHYRWRFYRSKVTSEPQWQGNVKSAEWQTWYQTGENYKELRFWSEEIK